MQKISCGVCYLVGETEIPNNVVLIAVEEHRKNTVQNKTPAFCMQGHKHHHQILQIKYMMGRNSVVIAR